MGAEFERDICIVTNKSTQELPTNEDQNTLHFDVSTGLKRVLGRELITNDEVAIFELVKNSYDADANQVHLYFNNDSIVIADDGSGMSRADLRDKWLFVAYSAKREAHQDRNYRNAAAAGNLYAGSKGIGRFSSDRIGKAVLIQSRPKSQAGKTVHKLTVHWDRFEQDDKEHFDQVPVHYRRGTRFILPSGLGRFGKQLDHGTVITIRDLRRHWDRDALLDLKAALAKLINPFGSKTDSFSIVINAPAERATDRALKIEATRANREPVNREIVNGRVGNFIFKDLQHKTTFVRVSIGDGYVNTELTDRGELVYRIREPNPYKGLKRSGFSCEIYYLNHSAKLTFARRIGLPSVQFGSVFLFRNNFRVYPIGEASDDWFGFDRRKQQGYSRYLGTREIIGRVDVLGSDEDFQEASSRNQGLIRTPAVDELRKAVMDHCLRRLERYVVPVSWADKADAKADDLSRLLTESGRARVSAAVASLVDNEDVELLRYSKRLVSLLNERSSEFESSIVSLRSIAEKTGDKTFLAQLSKAERRFDELSKSEAEAKRVADRERAVAAAATERAEAAEVAAKHEQRRSHFLESVVTLDVGTILNLHHQVTIYAVDIAQQVENYLSDTADRKSIPRLAMLKALEQIAFLNRKVLAVTRFATKANFTLDSEQLETDLPAFIADYVNDIARASESARTRVAVINNHPGLSLRFNPINVAIVVDNLISNAKRARASRITFELSPFDKNGIQLRVSDNGRGLARGANPERLFEMGYSTTQGSGLGLYHVRQVLGEIGGSIEVDETDDLGAAFLVKIVGRKSQ